MNSIKILIACHKPTDFLASDCLQPIQVGAAKAAVRLPDMLHDDEGENISALNPMYCELTAQYWAWKNLDCDYYGFFHYRRYLSFAGAPGSRDSWANLTEPFFDGQIKEKYGLSEESIRAFVEGADLVLPEQKNITQMPHMGKNMVEQYQAGRNLHGEDLDRMMDILKEKYPEFVPYAQRYLSGHTTFFNNMYIMKKELFEPYCAWLFDILDEFMKRADMADYSVEALRTPGHLAERLLNIYCLYLQDQKKDLVIKQAPTVAFLNTDPLVKPKPAFAKNNVAIALSANDYYAPYVSALLHSMKEQFTPQHNYDLLVMHRDIRPQTQRRLRAVFAGCENVSLRFFDVSRFGKQFEHLFLRAHFALETYFRLLMPELLPDYDKVLYLDCDVIVKADPALLYDTDVEGCLLAACHDADTAGLYNGYEEHKKVYMDQELKIEKPYEYFQAGVILFNLAEFRKQYTSAGMLEFAASNKWELLDQDVLNYLAQGRYKAVDMAWNVMTDWRYIRISDIVSRAPKYLRDEYLAAHAAPKIIHYAGPDKPWQQPDSDYAEEFWHYARQSDYYEELMQRLARQSAREVQPRPFKARARDVLKKLLMPAVNAVLPKYTKRREMVKALAAPFRR